MRGRTGRRLVVVPLAGSFALGACTGGPPAGDVPRARDDGVTATVAGLPDRADLDFVTQMIPHHEAGIAMSRAAERRAGSRAVRDLAAGIVLAQSREVALMRRWLHAWGAPEPRSWGMTGMRGGGRHDGMPYGTAGGRVDRMFLVMMIGHHHDAVALARTELASGHDPGVLALASRVLADQTAQIAVMERMLAERAGS